jgi:hypothetical protein
MKGNMMKKIQVVINSLFSIFVVLTIISLIISSKYVGYFYFAAMLFGLVSFFVSVLINTSLKYKVIILLVIFIFSLPILFVIFMKVAMKLEELKMKTEDIHIITETGNHLLVEEKYSSGFPESEFSYKIYELKDDKKILIDKLRRDAGDRIEWASEYDFMTYKYNGYLVTAYFINARYNPLLLYKIENKNNFCFQDFDEALRTPIKYKYLTPLARKIIYSKNKYDHYIVYEAIQFLLTVEDEKSYNEIKKVLKYYKKKYPDFPVVNSFLKKLETRKN